LFIAVVCPAGWLNGKIATRLNGNTTDFLPCWLAARLTNFPAGCLSCCLAARLAGYPAIWLANV
jgi:hypothetical protein